MAPKRKQPNPKDDAAAAAPVVRRSARLSTVAASVSVTVPEQPKKKKSKTKTKPAAVEKAAEPEAEAEAGKTIVIEHCKQCNSFKTRAIQVKEALEKDVAGVKVLINQDKPRRGCFEIRQEGGEVFVSLLDMKRPFPPLKALDMDALISDIVHKIQ